MLKKLLLALAALFLVLAGSLILIMGYVFNNPDSVFNAFNTVTQKFLQGQAYEENGEFFLQGMDEIIISSRSTDVQIKTYAGSTLKLSLKGKVPRFENGPFILQTPEKNLLHVELREPLASQWIQITVNGEEHTQESDAQLVAEVFIPESFKKKITVESRNGHLHLQLPEEVLYELDLQSISGKITNNLKQKPTSDLVPQEVGQIKLQTAEGSILVEPQD
ncbi:DUF4097 family beta strand repeat-containing protein [Bdellovibrio reynosensis]|uniref:Adhesin domain-containing protein n=1 Tax=Bdellovibrio reynosensis TaxID=2835041 RepID=A0ABY4C7J1_9BACT|nr:hypothetical protein [Bdellovibrio reynosensis]UOF00951.1 hypothetical protein MNR06_14715 [Bdellovibrio reynosensis]